MTSARTPFEVLPGGRLTSRLVGSIRVTAARANDPPFRVDAEVLEEDTWLTLSTPADVVVPAEHPVRVMTRAWEAEPEEPGSVIVRPGGPLRILAVVHDLDQEPTSTEAWVAEALGAALREVAEHGVRSLRLPLLTVALSPMTAERFVQILGRALVGVGAESPLQRVWLVRTSECGESLLAALDNN